VSWVAGRALRVLAAFILMYAAFLVYSTPSSATLPADLLVGAAVSFIGALLVANVLTTGSGSKIFNPRRWAWLLAYALHYFTLMELRAHLDVIKRILHPKMPIRPGIVRVPYHVETDHGIVAVANSVTNTPGTVVVDLDVEARRFYIHWIDVLSTEEQACFEAITKGFERYAEKAFE